ncbi:hypothetical protein BDQ17DRAFT_1435603 [Cyathus striatus]|nr:hypothetical protein BDQ17DRAFT_1435603 [Cyathus striatus]
MSASPQSTAQISGESNATVPASETTRSGSAVAIEHIFSGGRDTISICRASLKPYTIRNLMIVKQDLKLHN